jgi:uncharacterized Zn finger protein (UPF0148 family)
MIYVCNKCDFLFERTGEADICPNCEKDSVREANEIEQAKYQRKTIMSIRNVSQQANNK